MFYNPSMYTIADAPTSVRKRWRRKGSMTRLHNLLAECRLETEYLGDLRSGYEDVARKYLGRTGGGGEVVPTETALAEAPLVLPRQIEVPTSHLPKSQRKKKRKGRGRSAWHRASKDATFTVANNPELLVVNNPAGGRRMKRRRRRRRRNSKLTVKYRGRTRTWKGLVKMLGVRGAKKIWRRRGRRGRVYYHGGKRRVRCRIVRKRRKKSRNPLRKCTVRFRGRNVRYKTLVRAVGVKKASRMWRKSKRTKRKKGRKKRRKSRNSFR